LLKVAVICDSPLLEKSIKNFLKEYITPLGICDFVISDKKRELHKPIFYIGNHENSDLKKPFSKSTLLLKLEKFYDSGFYVQKEGDIDVLKQRITAITDRFLEDIFRELDSFAKHS